MLDGVEDLERLYRFYHFLYLFVSETVGCMVIDHSNGLHMGINHGGAKEFKTSFFKIFTEGIGFLGGCGD